MALKVLDLFSGIGGFSLGLENAGFETIAFCENDQSCKQVLNKHWPDIPVFHDVRMLKGRDFFGNMPDVVCGGFPCQDISVAGNKKGFSDEEEILSVFEREFIELQRDSHVSREGFEDNFSKLCERVYKAGKATTAKRTRSGLWKEFKRIIKEIKPRYVIIENVANLRNEGLNEIIKDLWQVGYACEWHIISARSIGACHLRERVWIIAYPNSKGLEGRGQKLQLGKDEGEVQVNGCSHDFTDPNMPRFWKAFKTEEASSRWWASATSSFSDRWEIKSPICRMDDGVQGKLDKNRKQEIMQLGNTILPQIPEILGNMIADYELKIKQ